MGKEFAFGSSVTTGRKCGQRARSPSIRYGALDSEQSRVLRTRVERAVVVRSHRPPTARGSPPHLTGHRRRARSESPPRIADKLNGQATADEAADQAADGMFVYASPAGSSCD